MVGLEGGPENTAQRSGHGLPGNSEHTLSHRLFSVRSPGRDSRANIPMGPS